MNFLIQINYYLPLEDIYTYQAISTKDVEGNKVYLFKEIVYFQLKYT